MRRRRVTPILGSLLAALLLALAASPVAAVGEPPSAACNQIYKAASRAAQAHDSAGAAKLYELFQELGCTPI